LSTLKIRATFLIFSATFQMIEATFLVGIS